MTTLDELVARRPPDWEAVQRCKEQMLAEIRAFQLREIRERYGLTQEDLARESGVSQSRVSSIKRGHVDSTRVGTLQRYAQALGGELMVEIRVGDQNFRIA